MNKKQYRFEIIRRGDDRYYWLFVVLERRRQTSGQLEKVRGSGMGESPESLRAKIARFFDLKGLA